jgi:hypothetical protein
MSEKVYQTIISTQTKGAASVIISSTYINSVWHYSLQAEVTNTVTGIADTASAGTLSVRGKLNGASTFQELGTISLSAPDPVVFDGFYVGIEAVSTGFDADKTWKLHIVGGD